MKSLKKGIEQIKESEVLASNQIICRDKGPYKEEKQHKEGHRNIIWFQVQETSVVSRDQQKVQVTSVLW